MFKQKIKSLLPKGFSRNVGILVGGTIAAQGIAFAALPILTRIYTPDDFAIFAIYFSCVGLLASVACFRLEILIPIAQDEKESFYLFILSITACLTISTLLGIVIFCLSDEIANLLGNKNVARYLWLIPFGVLSEGIYSSMQFWASRKMYFPLLAKSKICQTAGEATIQISMGTLSFSTYGLIVGHITKILAGSLAICTKIIEEEKNKVKSFTLHEAKSVYLKYRKSSGFSMLDALFNSAGSQMPLLIIASLVTGPELGFLMLAVKVAAAPMGLLGRNISQVYLSEAPKYLNEGRLDDLTSDIIGKLFSIGAPLIILLGCIAPLIFPILFGEGWTRSGEILLWMTPSFVLNFLAAPISMSLQVTGNQKLGFYLQVVGGIIRIGAIGMAALTPQQNVIEAYAISGFLFYLLYLLTIIKVTQIKITTLLKKAKLGASLSLISIIAGSITLHYISGL